MGDYEVVRINGKLTIRKTAKAVQREKLEKLSGKKRKSEYMEQYRKDHAEEIKANNKAWYERHKEEKRAKAREYYYKHKEQCREYQKAYYREKKAKLNEYQRDYQTKYYWRKKDEQLRMAKDSQH